MQDSKSGTKGNTAGRPKLSSSRNSAVDMVKPHIFPKSYINSPKNLHSQNFRQKLLPFFSNTAPLSSSFWNPAFAGGAFQTDETRKQRSAFPITFRRGRVCGFGDFGVICWKVLKAGSTALIEQWMIRTLRVRLEKPPLFSDDLLQQRFPHKSRLSPLWKFFRNDFV